jgi:hypothetical protein
VIAVVRHLDAVVDSRLQDGPALFDRDLTPIDCESDGFHILTNDIDKWGLTPII